MPGIDSEIVIERPAYDEIILSGNDHLNFETTPNCSNQTISN